jgi:hypothetical protein
MNLAGKKIFQKRREKYPHSRGVATDACFASTDIFWLEPVHA